ncbi:MAG: DUF2249 domain-containing protein [Bdellovibrionaceae bacterium]|nr:DUF2249 domain-containing protein [Bdellovibrionales bacterium]MCB9083803.1 DUF2249 domain-containing protein [Pseudobdellovibrionaceae bacterium]
MVDETLVDVRELAPPEPLEKALAAIDQLVPGKYICLHHRREPCGLLPRLKNLGCEHWISRDEDGFCEVFVWLYGDEESRRAIEQKVGRPMDQKPHAG